MGRVRDNQAAGSLAKSVRRFSVKAAMASQFAGAPVRRPASRTPGREWALRDFPGQIHGLAHQPPPRAFANAPTTSWA
jgi:hypothetical protein